VKKLIALSKLAGSYGVVEQGQEFDADDETARELMRLGHARYAEDPKVLYETQALTPSEAPVVASTRPFRHGTVRHAQPPPVASEGDSIVSGTDVSSERVTDYFRRRRRARSDRRS
jgi:hypothetical protein